MPPETKMIRIAEGLGPVSVPFSEALAGSASLNGLWLGQPGPLRFEVLEFSSASEPTMQSLRVAWHKRRGQRVVPLIVFWQGEHDVLMTEPVGEPATVSVVNVFPSAALAILRRALDTPHREVVSLVLSLLERTQGSGGVPGFRNRNMLSTHYLTSSYQRDNEAAWRAFSETGVALRAEKGGKLLREIGFIPDSTSAYHISVGGKLRVHALALPDGTPLDRSPTGPGAAPVNRLLVEARDKGADRAVIVAGHVLRLYPATASQGLDDISTAGTFVELDIDLLGDKWMGLLPLLFSADSHRPGGLFDHLLVESGRYAMGLRNRFRNRVYENIVENIARALYDARGRRNVNVALLFNATLRMLYRLLFVLYAEDRNLLPLGHPEYRRKSLTQTLLRLEGQRTNGQRFDPRQTTLWDDLFHIFDAIRAGSEEWNIPEYNGGLFEPQLADHPEASFLHAVKLPNAILAPILLDLAFDQECERRGKVDFGDLGVRHLGTLYEGLLSYSIQIADEDLTTDQDGLYIPAKKGTNVVVKAGDPYLTSPKGGRKNSGSYYTPAIVVRSLIDGTLRPNLEAHLKRVEELPPEQQWDAMLDYRIVDPAMGSGHFLVDALDTVSDRLSRFLKDHPRISAEPIARARKQITKIGKRYGLESLGDGVGDFELLRRTVMRRCIYGIDQNPMAVELAKVGLWLHAFVPGLPLSYLGHNLRHGNALVGIVGDEIEEQLEGKLFGTAVSNTLDSALAQAKRLAALGDLSLDEVKASEKAQSALEVATVELRNALDAYSCRVFATGNPDLSPAERVRGRSALERGTGLQEVLTGTVSGVEKKQIENAKKRGRELSALHWQLAFPEVFLRDTPGFDVILGNPPWDKVRFEEQQFWVSRVPGLNSLSADQRESRIKQLRVKRPLDASAEEAEQEHRESLQVYFKDAFSHQGRGHLDLSKLFVERVLSLRSESGSIGYVLPGQAMVIGGWSKLREILSGYDLKITEARNTAGWMFPDADFRLIVAFVSIAPPTRGGKVMIVPGISSARDLEASSGLPAVSLSPSDINALSDAHIIPWLNNSSEVSVLNKMRGRPSLNSGEGWITGQSESKWDFSGSGRERELARSTRAQNGWHVLMARHVDQYRIDTSVTFQRWIPRPTALIALNKNIVAEGGQVVLGPEHARIVYRYPARADDSRTVIATYLPKAGYLPSTGYVHSVSTRGATASAILALVAYMNSLVCDWWARRFVDRHVTAPVINALPLPEWSSRDIEAIADCARVLLSADPIIAAELNLPIASESERISARIFIEERVSSGFGFEEHELATVLSDFSATAAVAPLPVLAALRAGRSGQQAVGTTA